MRPRCVVSTFLLLAALSGCSSPPAGEEERHRGAKINIADFIRNPVPYKGKAITLDLKVDEAIAKDQTLRDYVGRDVKFMTLGPKGERLDLVITLPKALTVPEVGRGDMVMITFLCTRGSLREGNEARFIDTL
jgi:hypothetical protein